MAANKPKNNSRSRARSASEILFPSISKRPSSSQLISEFTNCQQKAHAPKETHADALILTNQDMLQPQNSQPSPSFSSSIPSPVDPNPQIQLMSEQEKKHSDDFLPVTHVLASFHNFRPTARISLYNVSKEILKLFKSSSRKNSASSIHKLIYYYSNNSPAFLNENPSPKSKTLENYSKSFTGIVDPTELPYLNYKNSLENYGPVIPEPLYSQLESDAFIERLSGLDIYWLKVHGHRWWPVQVIPRVFAELKYVQFRIHALKHRPVCVMYFGTNQVSWSSESNLVPWRDGILKGFHKPSKKIQPGFDYAIELLYDVFFDPPTYPEGWWSLRQNLIWSTEPIDNILPEVEQDFTLPNDFFSYKLPKYKTIHQCEWPKHLTPKRPHRDEIFVCQCQPRLKHINGGRKRKRIEDGISYGCGEDCINRKIGYLCSPEYCPAGDTCANKPFQLMPKRKLKIFETENFNRGWGIKSCEFIAEGEFVIEYIGEVINSEEMDRRLQEDIRNEEHNYYIMKLSGNLYIDSRYKGNKSRLINSSCEPNCRTQCWIDTTTGCSRVGIFAVRNIEPGEELSYDYKYQTFGNTQNTQPQPCFCGSQNCRGQLALKKAIQPSTGTGKTN